MVKVTQFLFLISVAVSARAADETTARLARAAAVFAKLTTAIHEIRPEQISADCIAVVPGFKKGVALVGVEFGRGFTSCRTDAGRSAPGAIAFETGSEGIQLGAEDIDIVIPSMDRSRRPKLLSDRFAIDPLAIYFIKGNRG
jgi:SH3 domain-containing YSC84-like protein 1